MNPYRATLAAAGALALAACDIPTEAPLLDSRWILEAESTTIGVADLLPSGVSISGSDFAVDVDPFDTSQDLGNLCAQCVALNLTTAPKPAFDETFTASVDLPSDVSSANLTSGSISVALNHNLGFDPIRPPGGSAGKLTITVTDGEGGRELGQLVLDGATDAFPTGTTLTRTLSLASGSVGATLFMTVEVNSPAGGQDPTDWVPINTSNVVSASATPSGILVAAAEVDVGGRDVTIDPVSLDVQDVDNSVTDHIQQGAIILDIQNPFGVAFDGQLQITVGGGTVVSKSFSVANTATSSTSVTLSKADFQSFLGQPNVALTGTGTVTSSGSITVNPTMEVDITGKIDLTLRIGG